MDTTEPPEVGWAQGGRRLFAKSKGMSAAATPCDVESGGFCVPVFGGIAGASAADYAIIQR